MNEFIVNNFLPADHNEAKRQLDCHKHCTEIALKKKLLGDKNGSDAYIENAKRSEYELINLRNKHDRAWYVNKRIEADLSMKKIVQKQAASVYE